MWSESEGSGCRMPSTFPRCPISELGWGQLGTSPLPGDKAEDLLPHLLNSDGLVLLPQAVCTDPGLPCSSGDPPQQLLGHGWCSKGIVWDRVVWDWDGVGLGLCGTGMGFCAAKGTGCPTPSLSCTIPVLHHPFPTPSLQHHPRPPGIGDGHTALSLTPLTVQGDTAGSGDQAPRLGSKGLGTKRRIPVPHSGTHGAKGTQCQQLPPPAPSPWWH